MERNKWRDGSKIVEFKNGDWISKGRVVATYEATDWSEIRVTHFHITEFGTDQRIIYYRVSFETVENSDHTSSEVMYFEPPQRGWRSYEFVRVDD